MSTRSGDHHRRWFITAGELRERLPDVTVVDVRGAPAFHLGGRVPGAVRIPWHRFRDGRGRTGRLASDLAAVAAGLAASGIDASRPVAVYGRADRGWGEEGRAAWMLYHLGHPDVCVLDGGWRAWLAAGGERSWRRASSVPGHFPLRPVVGSRATADDVASAGERGAALVDTRSRREWNGSWRFLPARRGRIPGAVHVEWRSLLTPDGRLDRSPAARDRLAALGLAPARPVITYCVAGVRSAELFWLLKGLGYEDVRNYDGSWYEWAADRRRPIISGPSPPASPA